MYNNILLAIDLEHDDSWVKALPTSLSLCENYGSTLHLLTVLPDFGMSIVGQFFPDNFEDDMAKKALEKLQDFSAEKIPSSVKVQNIIGNGNPYESILEVAEKTSADLIIVSAHRAKLKDYLLGPNAARVVRHANCSVLVVRD